MEIVQIVLILMSPGCARPGWSPESKGNCSKDVSDHRILVYIAPKSFRYWCNPILNMNFGRMGIGIRI